jgi:hypothetical protein
VIPCFDGASSPPGSSSQQECVCSLPNTVPLIQPGIQSKAYTYTMYIHSSDFTSLYRRIYEVRGAACGGHVVVIGRQPDMPAVLVGGVSVPQTGVQAVRFRLFRNGNWRSLSSMPCRHVQCKRRGSRQMHTVPEQADHAGNHRRRVSHCLLVPTRFVFVCKLSLLKLLKGLDVVGR